VSKSSTSLYARAVSAVAVLSCAVVLAPPAGAADRIAFARQGRHQGIWTMTPEGKALRQLTTRRDFAPTWSPDGDRLAFRRWNEENHRYDVFVMRADGSRERRAGTQVFGPPRREFTWAPDGDRLAYWTRDDEDVDRVVVVDLATGEETVIEGAMSPSWSPDGGRIAYSAKRADHPECGAEVFTARPDGSDPVQVTDHVFANDDEPVWSPDGESIAFVSTRDYDHGEEPEECEEIYGFAQAHEVYVVPAGGGDPERLTRHSTYKYRPVWSPDGSSIAYESACSIDLCDENRHEVFAVGLEGRRRNLTGTDRRDETLPAWSPDGEHLVYTSSRGYRDRRIEIVAASGEGRRRIVYDRSAAFDPHWRP
jgi:TolB protein